MGDPVKYELHTEIDIEAPPTEVWAILTDVDAYADWNPFVVSSSGTLAVGERLSNRMQPPGGKAMNFSPTVTVVEPARTFEWLGHLGVAGLFDGRHRFELTETATGTHLTHSEYFNGILVRFLRKSLDTQTLAGFEAMNDALKTRAEANERTAS